MKAQSKTVLTALFGAVACLVWNPLSSMAADKYGQEIPTNVPTVKLEKIMENPAVFKDKEVVLVGNYAGHCCATDFNYKEGLNGAECYYPGFNVPKGKAGRPVKIYAVIRVRGAEEGEAVEEEKAESNEEKQSGGDSIETTAEESGHVTIEAKGVEFK